MSIKPVRPTVKEVRLCDGFWAPYLEKIRTVSLPYILDKFEEKGYFDCFRQVIDGVENEHKCPPFSDGLVFETMRGVCDFLATQYDAELDARIDGYIELIKRAQDKSGDGFLCTKTTCTRPTERWGQNGGDIIIQHDLYNHGALVEAAISHYLATGKTSLLECAVKGAQLICSYIGYPPKNNIIPGHSLPEEAFVKLYRLFRDHRELDGFAAQYSVNARDYLDIATFWYDNRGNYEGRTLAHDPKFAPKYNQDHLPFAEQRTAEGHAVRAALCYSGASMVAYETDRADYRVALDAIWENIITRKLHISGGIGARHDIEGFDRDYDLPATAYLETCAAIAFAFFCGERNLLEGDAECFDYFERSLYNNILASIAEDGTHYFYKNPLVSDGSIRRWDWHGCPCCPPMLLKLYSSLATYAYAYSDTDIYVNLLIDSEVDTASFRATLKGGVLTANTFGGEMTVRIRIPEYAKNFTLSVNGTPITYETEKGYALIRGVLDENTPIAISFDAAPRLVVCNPLAAANLGHVAVMCGPTLYCAEGFDNGGDVTFTVAEKPELTLDGDTVRGKTADGQTFTLIPYYRWCNRESDIQSERVMRVWLPFAGMPSYRDLKNHTGSALYVDFNA